VLAGSGMGRTVFTRALQVQRPNERSRSAAALLIVAAGASSEGGNGMLAEGDAYSNRFGNVVVSAGT
jgi:hypothetical protein